MGDTERLLVGRQIVAVRAMTRDELDREYWLVGYRRDEQVTAIELDNGLVLYPSRDEEGNGPGEIFVADETGPIGMIFVKAQKEETA